MTALLWLAGGWLLLAALIGPLVGRFLKHRSPDAPQGQIGDLP